MDEFISRKAAFEILQSRLDGISQMSYLNMNWHELEIMRDAIEHAIDDVGEVPSADVQPVKHGRWENEYLDDDDVWWADCTNCNNDTHSRFGRVSIYAYCPNCGARMDLNGATPDRCRNYIDCDGSCYIDDSPCECGGNIEKCKGRDTE